MILNPFTTPVYLKKIKIDDDFSTSIFNKILSINRDGWSQLSLIFLKSNSDDKEEQDNFQENKKLDLKLILNLLLQLNNIKQLNKESKINYSLVERNITNSINSYLNNLKISDTKNYFKLNTIFNEIKNNFLSINLDSLYVNNLEESFLEETKENINVRKIELENILKSISDNTIIQSKNTNGVNQYYSLHELYINKQKDRRFEGDFKNSVSVDYSYKYNNLINRTNKYLLNEERGTNQLISNNLFYNDFINKIISKGKFIFEEKKQWNFNNKHLNTVDKSESNYKDELTVWKYNDYKLNNKIENSYEEIRFNNILHNNYRFIENSTNQSLKFLNINKIFNLLNGLNIRKNQIYSEKFNTDTFPIFNKKKDYKNLFMERSNYLIRLEHLLNADLASRNSNKFSLMYLTNNMNSLYSFKYELKTIEKSLFAKELFDKFFGINNRIIKSKEILNYTNILPQNSTLNYGIKQENLSSKNAYYNLDLNAYKNFNLREDYYFENVRNIVNSYNNLNSLKRLIKNYVIHNLNENYIFAKNILAGSSIINDNKQINKAEKIYNNILYKRPSILTELKENQYYLRNNKKIPNINNVYNRQVLTNIQYHILQSNITNKVLQKENYLKNEILKNHFNLLKADKNKYYFNNSVNIADEYIERHKQESESKIILNLENSKEINKIHDYEEIYFKNQFLKYKTHENSFFNVNVYKNKRYFDFYNKYSLKQEHYFNNKKDTILTYNQLYLNNMQNYYKNNSRFIRNLLIDNTRILNYEDNKIENRPEKNYYSTLTANKKKYNLDGNVINIINDYIAVYSSHKKENMVKEYKVTNIIKNYKNEFSKEKSFLKNNIGYINSLKKSVYEYSKLYLNLYSISASRKTNYALNDIENVIKTKNYYFTNLRTLIENYYLNNINSNFTKNIFTRNSMSTLKKELYKLKKRYNNSLNNQTSLFIETNENQQYLNNHEKIVSAHIDDYSNILKNINHNYLDNNILEEIIYKNSNLEGNIEDDYYNLLNIKNGKYYFNSSVEIIKGYLEPYVNNIRTNILKNSKASQLSNQIQSYLKVFSKEKSLDNKIEYKNLLNINAHEYKNIFEIYNELSFKEVYYLKNIKDKVIDNTNYALNNFKKLIGNNELFHESKSNYFSSIKAEMNHTSKYYLSNIIKNYIFRVGENNLETKNISSKIFENNILKFKIISMKNLSYELLRRQIHEKIYKLEDYKIIKDIFINNIIRDYEKQISPREIKFNQVNYKDNLLRISDKKIKMSSEKINNLIINTIGQKNIQNSSASKDLSKEELSEEYKIDANIKYKKQTQFSTINEDVKEVYENTQSYLNENEINKIINETVENVVSQKLALKEASVESEEEKIDYITKKVLSNVEKTLNYEKRKRGLI